jgi:hypothetical protein
MILNAVLWVVQIALAAFFAYAGYIKLAKPIAEIAKIFPWPAEVPAWSVRLLGAVDIAGAIGLLVPQLAGVLPWLTLLAALGLVALQVAAIIFHAIRGETRETVAMNLALVVGSAFVLWGRWYLFAG